MNIHEVRYSLSMCMSCLVFVIQSHHSPLPHSMVDSRGLSLEEQFVEKISPQKFGVYVCTVKPQM